MQKLFYTYGKVIKYGAVCIFPTESVDVLASDSFLWKAFRNVLNFLTKTVSGTDCEFYCCYTFASIKAVHINHFLVCKIGTYILFTRKKPETNNEKLSFW